MTAASPNGRKVGGWDIALRFTVPIVLAVGAAVITHEVRISRIESNRFTNRDAHELERRLLEVLPPTWLRDDLTEIKTMLKGFDKRLLDLERKVK